MKMFKIQVSLSFLSVLMAVLLNGCATTGQSAGMGALVGAAAGAGVGALADPGAKGKNRFRNVMIGTAAGAAVGAGAGILLGEHVKDERETARTEGKRDAMQEYETSHAGASEGISLAPTLIPARTEAHWVPDQVRGTFFIPGHFEYQIVEGARWEVVK